MQVKELIQILKLQEQEATVIIAQSQYDWDNVLVIIEDPATPDEAKEIRIGS